MAMGSDQVTSRRAMLASLALFAPAAANAIVPGLNGPGLVPAKKVPKSTSTGFGRDFENIRDKTNFWSSQGVRAPLLPPGHRCCAALASSFVGFPPELALALSLAVCVPPRCPSLTATPSALSHPRDPARLWQIMDSVPKMKGIITPKTAGYKTK